jgi:hypothetical protein
MRMIARQQRSLRARRHSHNVTMRTDGSTPASGISRLLLVWHSRTGLARHMSDAMEAGALAVSDEMDVPLHVSKRRAVDASIDDVLRADGYLFCAPENLASASGEMLEFFHRTYYHAFAASQSSDEETSLLLGRPYGLAIAAGSDGNAAARQIARIATGWRLRPCAEPLIHQNGLPQTKENILAAKTFDSAGEAARQCREIGGLVAATVLL